MEKYSKYKDSGVKWIGKIPEHWEVKLLSQMATLHYLSNKDVHHQNLLSLSYGRIINKDINGVSGLLPASYDTYQIIEDGNIVLRLTDLQNDQKSLRVGLCTQEGIITSAYLALQPRVTVLPAFLYLLLHAADIMKVFYSMGNGLRQNLNWGELRKLSCVLPPLAEQRAIVSYLDGKVGQIDTYVAKQTQQIELLKELKQAVIANAVTKGIDNKAKLKQTGISWIGHVPQHWEQCRLKNVVSCNNETLSNNTEPSLQIEYVEIADVKEMEGIVRTTHYKFSEAPSRARRITKNGDIILSTVRTYLKAVALVKQEGLIVSTGFAVLRPKDCNQEYISYLLRSDYFLGEVSRRSFGISYPSITTDALLSIEIPIPPLSEQRAIVSYIEAKTASINKLIDAYEQQVERVKEYKQRLISDAVTGKMNVTDEQTQTN